MAEGTDQRCPDCRADLVLTRQLIKGRVSGKKSLQGSYVVLLSWNWLVFMVSNEHPTPTTNAKPRLNSRPPRRLMPPPPPTSSAGQSPETSFCAFMVRTPSAYSLYRSWLKPFCSRRVPVTVDQVPGLKAREFYVQGQLDSDTQPEAIEIHAHGSTTAFTDLKSGTCDLGMSSRKVTMQRKSKNYAPS